jgi:hypothetical protein
MSEIRQAGPQIRPEFAGNRKRYAPGQKPPPLQFGPHGELTPKTIKQANLGKEEEKRAFEMLKVQAAYIEILEALSYPVDPEGHVHDLTALGPTKVAIAWTLALNGFRSSGKKYIKKRHYDAPGIYDDAHTWVDVRAADAAEQELQPEHRQSDLNLPPYTRRLAAIRDGDPAAKLPQWQVEPEVTWERKPREEEGL